MRVDPRWHKRLRQVAAATVDPREPKPAGMAWNVYLVHVIERVMPLDLRGVTERIGEEILRHYQVVSTPIAPAAPHPLTGLSWAFLLELVHRGGRAAAQPWADEHPDLQEDHGQEDAWVRYRDEIQQVIDAGTWDELGHPGGPPTTALELIPPGLRRRIAARH